MTFEQQANTARYHIHALLFAQSTATCQEINAVCRSHGCSLSAIGEAIWKLEELELILAEEFELPDGDTRIVYTLA